jgi:N-acetylglutamate synthase
MSIQITEMTTTDYDDVVAFWKEQDGVGLNEADGREQMAGYLSRNQGMSLVARDEGKVVAAILCGHDGRRGYLHHLAVAGPHRGRGIGTSLVERCLERLGREGIAKCNVFVFGDNCDGEEFWKAIGFKARTDLKLLQRPTSILPPLSPGGV